MQKISNLIMLAHMTYFLPILLLFVFFFAGMLAARFDAVRRSAVIERVSGWILPALLLVMGYRIGLSAESGSELARSGLVAAVFAAAGAAGTFLAAGLLCLADRRRPEHAAEAGRSPGGGYGGSFLLLGMVVLGFVAARLLPESGLDGGGLTDWLLRFLLFSIGIDMVKSGISFTAALADRNTILLPVLTVAGSLAGGAVAAMVLDMSVWKGLSVASGFGWYTLSGVLITDLGDPVLGSTAFLTNLLREAAAIAVIPFLGRTIFARAAVGVAGATSMDVTLPLVERASGPGMVPLSISHGVMVSMLVPVLAPLFYRLG